MGSEGAGREETKRRWDGTGVARPTGGLRRESSPHVLLLDRPLTALRKERTSGGGHPGVSQWDGTAAFIVSDGLGKVNVQTSGT